MKHIKKNLIDSTQQYLYDNFDELTSLDHDVLISTNQQTKGVGRRGNQWIDQSNALAFSFTLQAHSKQTLTPLELGALLSLYIEKKFDKEIFLKWPNDILTSKGEKVGGILCQLKGSTVVAGIGLNLGHSNNVSEICNDRYTVSTVLDSYISSDLQHEIPHEIVQFIKSNRLDEQTVIEEWKKRCLHIDKPVTIINDSNEVSGIFKGIGQWGQAVIEIDKESREFYSGSLRFTI